MTHQAHCGILGGGQLGRFLTQSLKKRGARVSILDRRNCPAAEFADHLVEGDFRDPATVSQFAKTVDRLTIEIENVGIDQLDDAALLSPSKRLIETIKDRKKQKDFLIDAKIPTADYQDRPWPDQPCVQKVCVGGYDGKGTKILEPGAKPMSAESIFEKKIPIAKEISVIVARDASGRIVHFPLVEMIFDPDLHLVDYVICPASISSDISAEAVRLAERAAEAFSLEGLLAIEMFITKEGEVLVNEMAPRPHNSGHHTIEACDISQYEMLARILLEEEIQPPQLKTNAAVMANLLGAPGHEGSAIFEGAEKFEKDAQVFIHSYGKLETKPGRKMGHITVLGNSTEEALNKAKEIKSWIKVKAKAK